MASEQPGTSEVSSPAAVTLRSLLTEMIDRDAVARWPAPAFQCKQASSHDRRKTNPDDPETWHTNTDYGQFLRTEENEGRKEWVVMDDRGPGAITRIWAPLLPEKDDQTVRFYFDGSKTPAIAVKWNELMSGRAFARPPLAFVSWNADDLREQLKPDYEAPRGVGGDLYLPLPFATGCKVTLDREPFYYVINYRIYDPGTPVSTFSMTDFEAVKDTMDQVSEALLGRPDTGGGGPEERATLGKGEAVSLRLPRGPAAVSRLRVQFDPKAGEGALRSLVVEATFDGERTVWCPLGEFFGAGARMHPVRDWFRTVGQGGAMEARWVMPYRRSGRITLKNVGEAAVGVSLSADTKPWDWDDRSMHFHATWRSQHGLKTRPMSVWNYLEASGQGVYVGDTLTVFSPVKAWYGEGDERIAIDGEAVPSHIGTGTEDYYGFAWGMANRFNSPFVTTALRDGESREDWRGYTTTSRVRLLDGIPFRSELRHDMEIWNWADTRVDYAVGSFWYARSGVKSNRRAQPGEAARLPKPFPPEPAPFKIEGAVECETMEVASASPGLIVGTQDTVADVGKWSGGRQLFVQAKNVGDFIELKVPASGTGRRKLTLYGTKSWDYGILRFSVNGERAGRDYDAYRSPGKVSGPIPLGTFEPVGGMFLLRVEVVGANPATTGARHYFGLDCVRVEGGK